MIMIKSHTQKNIHFSNKLTYLSPASIQTQFKVCLVGVCFVRQPKGLECTFKSQDFYLKPGQKLMMLAVAAAILPLDHFSASSVFLVLQYRHKYVLRCKKQHTSSYYSLLDFDAADGCMPLVSRCRFFVRNLDSQTIFCCKYLRF